MRIAQDSHGKYHFIGNSVGNSGHLRRRTGGPARGQRAQRTNRSHARRKACRCARPSAPVPKSTRWARRWSATTAISATKSATSKPTFPAPCCSPWCCRRASPARCGFVQSNFPLRSPGRRRTEPRPRPYGRVHARPHADRQGQRARDEPGRPGLDCEDAVASAEEELKAGNVDRATRLLSNAIQGTQRLGNVKATQALVGLMDQVKKTQTLADQGGQDHAPAGPGRGAQDPDARSGCFEGFFQARPGVTGEICPWSRPKMATP